jgi:osmoprotectant transport system permease protein
MMYHAVENGEADVISAFSSDGRIAALDLLVLEDPKHAIPSYDALILIAPKRPADERLR